MSNQPLIDMKFCTKCGSLMLPKKDSKHGMILACANCKYTLKQGAELKISESFAQDKKEIPVVDPDLEESTLPTTEDIECEKCKNTTAYYWVVQTRASDEPETKFLKCTKCKHTWRDYN